jgi:hypothetical protein
MLSANGMGEYAKIGVGCVWRGRDLQRVLTLIDVPLSVRPCYEDVSLPVGNHSLDRYCSPFLTSKESFIVQLLGLVYKIKSTRR